MSRWFHPELSPLGNKLKAAMTAESIFGMDAAKAEIEYRRLAKICHPDRHPTNVGKAQEVFVLLQDWWTRAQARMAAGVYGQPDRELVQIETKKHSYTVTENLARGDLANLYLGWQDSPPGMPAGIRALVKVAREPFGDDFVKREYESLAKLRKEPGFLKYLPAPFESFTLHKRRGTVFGWEPGLVTMRELREAYPDGLDPRDVAWMFKRMLAVLGHVHHHGLVHGAVTPDHCLLRLSDHGLVLVGWGASVDIGTRLQIAATDWLDLMYPPEVKAKKPATAATDIYMAAATAVWMMGKHDIPGRLVSFFASCLLAPPGRRPQDAWDLHEDYDVLLRRLYGPPAFRHLSMPATARA